MGQLGSGHAILEPIGMYRGFGVGLGEFMSCILVNFCFFIAHRCRKSMSKINVENRCQKSMSEMSELSEMSEMSEINVRNRCPRFRYKRNSIKRRPISMNHALTG